MRLMSWEEFRYRYANMDTVRLAIKLFQAAALLRYYTIPKAMAEQAEDRRADKKFYKSAKFYSEDTLERNK